MAINSDDKNENNNCVDHIIPLFMGPGSGTRTRPLGKTLFPSEINYISAQMSFLIILLQLLREF